MKLDDDFLVFPFLFFFFNDMVPRLRIAYRFSASNFHYMYFNLPGNFISLVGKYSDSNVAVTGISLYA